LCSQFQKALPAADVADSESLQEMRPSDLPLGVLTDLMSFALPLSASLKRRLLGECDVQRRAETLADALQPAPSRRSPTNSYAFADFAPRFSDN
jgi:hypothetical protein